MRSLVSRLTRRYGYTGRRNGSQPPVSYSPPHAAWPPPSDPWLWQSETQILPTVEREVRRAANR